MKTYKLHFILIFILTALLQISDLSAQPYTPGTNMKNGFYLGANGGFLYPEYYYQQQQLGFTTNVDWGNSYKLQVIGLKVKNKPLHKYKITGNFCQNLS